MATVMPAPSEDTAPTITRHPPGTIGVSAGEFLRYGAFVMSLLKCGKPPGTQVSFSHSISIPENWNDICRGLTGDWLWIQGDDGVWEPDALERLLDHEADVVVPLILRRGPPFVPVVFKAEVEAGYVPFAYDEIPSEGLFPVVMAGSHGMLVRRHVLDAIVEMQGHDRLFEYQPGEVINEDFVFARKIIQAGYQIMCDPTVVLGHIGTFTIFPRFHEGHWRIGFDMGMNKQRERSVFYFDPGEQQRS